MELQSNEAYFLDSYPGLRGIAYSENSLGNEPLLSCSFITTGSQLLVLLKSNQKIENSVVTRQGKLFSADSLTNTSVHSAIFDRQGRLFTPGSLANTEIGSSKLGGQGVVIRATDLKANSVTSNSIFKGQGRGGFYVRLINSSFAKQGEISYSLDQLFSKQTANTVAISKESLMKVGLQPLNNNSPESLYLAILLFSKEALSFKKDNSLPSVSIEEQGGVLVTRNSKYYKQDTYTVTLRKEDTKPIIDPDNY